MTTTTDTSVARLVVCDNVANITLSSPLTRNALSLAMLTELARCAELAVNDPEIAVIVLRGEGPVFSVGGFIDELAAADNAHQLLHEVGEVLNPLIHTLHTGPKVVVAGVQGAVAGGALGLMSAADLIVSAEGTVFTFAYSKIGGTPDGGVSWLTQRDVGYRRAIELYLTSERLSATQAFEHGLINRVVPDDDLDTAIDALATTLARGPTAAFAAAKALLRDARTATLQQQLRAEIHAFADISTGPDFQERVAAFVARSGRGAS